MVDGLDHALDGLDEAVGVAMRTVPRHTFVEEQPYDNRASDHAGTDVLAPRTVARLLDALAVDEGEETLVVGVGVGYTAALTAELVGERHVHAVDIARRLVLDARRNLSQAGYEGVLVDRRDGANGLPEYAPFDRILVEAAAVRPPRSLLEQLVADGRLVMPMGTPEQTLVAVEPNDSSAGYAVVDEFGSAAFEPLLVEGEQAGGVTRNRPEREEHEFAEQGYFAPTGWEQEWIDWDDRPDGGRGHRRR